MGSSCPLSYLYPVVDAAALVHVPVVHLVVSTVVQVIAVLCRRRCCEGVCLSLVFSLL